MSSWQPLPTPEDVKMTLGFSVKADWLAQMLQQLQAAQAGNYNQLPHDKQMLLLLEQLLIADFRTAGAGGLLAAAVQDMQSQHTTRLPGKYMLQLDEIVNISATIKDRYQEQRGPNRCLKLHLTDGVQQLVAIEQRHVAALGVLMPAGLKLLIVNPSVRRGMLLLQPENVVVLGGVVEQLEAARQALLQHANKPADHCEGRRTCEQFYQQARGAAWSSARCQQTQPPQDDTLQQAQQQQRQQPQQQQPQHPQAQQQAQYQQQPQQPLEQQAWHTAARQQPAQQPLQQQQQHSQQGNQQEQQPALWQQHSSRQQQLQEQQTCPDVQQHMHQQQIQRQAIMVWQQQRQAGVTTHEPGDLALQQAPGFAAAGEQDSTVGQPAMPVLQRRHKSKQQVYVNGVEAPAVQQGQQKQQQWQQESQQLPAAAKGMQGHCHQPQQQEEGPAQSTQRPRLRLPPRSALGLRGSLISTMQHGTQHAVTSGMAAAVQRGRVVENVEIDSNVGWHDEPTMQPKHGAVLEQQQLLQQANRTALEQSQRQEQQQTVEQSDPTEGAARGMSDSEIDDVMIVDPSDSQVAPQQQQQQHLSAEVPAFQRPLTAFDSSSALDCTDIHQQHQPGSLLPAEQQMGEVSQVGSFSDMVDNAIFASTAEPARKKSRLSYTSPQRQQVGGQEQQLDSDRTGSDSSDLDGAGEQPSPYTVTKKRLKQLSRDLTSNVTTTAVTPTAILQQRQGVDQLCNHLAAAAEPSVAAAGPVFGRAVLQDGTNKHTAGDMCTAAAAANQLDNSISGSGRRLLSVSQRKAQLLSQQVAACNPQAVVAEPREPACAGQWSPQSMSGQAQQQQHLRVPSQHLLAADQQFMLQQQHEHQHQQEHRSPMQYQQGGDDARQACREAPPAALPSHSADEHELSLPTAYNQQQGSPATSAAAWPASKGYAMNKAAAAAAVTPAGAFGVRGVQLGSSGSVGRQGSGSNVHSRQGNGSGSGSSRQGSRSSARQGSAGQKHVSAGTVTALVLHPSNPVRGRLSAVVCGNGQYKQAPPAATGNGATQQHCPATGAAAAVTAACNGHITRAAKDASCLPAAIPSLFAASNTRMLFGNLLQQLDCCDAEGLGADAMPETVGKGPSGTGKDAKRDAENSKQAGACLAYGQVAQQQFGAGTSSIAAQPSSSSCDKHAGMQRGGSGDSSSSSKQSGSSAADGSSKRAGSQSVTAMLARQKEFTEAGAFAVKQPKQVVNGITSCLTAFVSKVHHHNPGGAQKIHRGFSNLLPVIESDEDLEDEMQHMDAV